MVRDYAVIAETMGIGLALSHQGLRLMRRRPGNAGQLLGLMFDVFQQHDRGTIHPRIQM
jgi:hypothetical protein